MVKNLSQRLFGRQLGVLEGSLGLRAARHDLTASNLANIDTPGYTAKHLNFEEVLANKISANDGQLGLRQTSVNHLPTKNPQGAFEKAGRSLQTSPYGRDEYENDIIDLDKEMTLLTKNQLVYNVTVQMLAKEFENLKYAISEGGQR